MRMPLSAWWWCAVVAIATGADADYVTWNGCPNKDLNRELQPGVTDKDATILDLKQCNIYIIVNLNFPNLELLALTNNYIRNISDHVFDSLPELRSLYLGYNSLNGEDIHPNALRNCKKLKRIGFTGNNMTGTPHDLLQGLDSLDTLWLDNCSLHEIPGFAMHSSLKELLLYDNQIKALDNPDGFVLLRKLTKLHLYNNIIDLIHEDTFQLLTNIQDIDLSINNIQHLPNTLFANLSNLRMINLERNKIEYVPSEIFNGCKSLGRINLENNRLTYLPENFITQFDNLKYFYFERNQWQCGCLNEILVEVKSKGIQYRSEDYNGKKPVCVNTEFRCHRVKDLYRQLYESMIQTVTSTLARP